jgi:probable addiction module antidote protein
MPKRSVPHHAYLVEKLRNPEIAAAYIGEAAKESSEAFLKALRKVAEAHQMSKIAEAAGVQRESLYRMLCESGNPRLESLRAVTETMGLRVTVEPLTMRPRRASEKARSTTKSESRGAKHARKLSRDD